MYLLRSQVFRHLDMPHEFVCVTDRPGDIDNGIRTIPIDKRLHIPGGRYAKLAIFAPDAGEVFGSRILTLDLDVVIVDDITPLVDRPEDLVLWRNPNFGLKRRAFYNTSIMLVTAGARPGLYTGFDAQRTPQEALGATGWGGTDQCALSYMLSRDRRFNAASFKEAFWTADDGVYGQGRLGDYCPDLAHIILPENARIVFFPGRRHPKMPEMQKKHPWIVEHRH